MRDYDYIIVGGGLAAASAVDGIREVDSDGSIVMLSEETEPPYHRPPLSKEYLQSEDAPRDLLYIKPETWVEDARLELRTETSVVGLEPRGLTVTTSHDEVLRAGRILLATGGRPRDLDLPGRELAGIQTYRTVEDAETLRSMAAKAGRVALIGGGFIGMELAASLTTLDVRPIVIELEDRVWWSLFPPEISSFMRHYFEERGVEFRLGRSVEAFRGDDILETVVLDDGAHLACDLAVIGVGISPADSLATAAGMAVQDGIMIDEFGETSHAHIYASGDVACFPDPVFEDLGRVEHWDHAKAHGRLVGRNMAGEREPYEHVSYFFTNVFDLSINVFGRPESADQLVLSGELGSRRSVIYCGAEGRLVGTIMVNAPETLEENRELMRRRPSMDDLEPEPGPEVGELVG